MHVSQRVRKFDTVTLQDVAIWGELCFNLDIKDMTAGRKFDASNAHRNWPAFVAEGLKMAALAQRHMHLIAWLHKRSRGNYAIYTVPLGHTGG